MSAYHYVENSKRFKAELEKLQEKFMKTEETTYHYEDNNYIGFVAYPEKELAPLVLIAHTWAGRDSFVQEKAKELAELGYIAMAVDQLGVELFSIDSVGSVPELVGRIDTEGNAEKVTMVTEGVYVACDDAGAAFIPIESFSSDNMTYRFAEDLTVEDIACHL